MTGGLPGRMVGALRTNHLVRDMVHPAVSWGPIFRPDPADRGMVAAILVRPINTIPVIADRDMT